MHAPSFSAARKLSATPRAAIATEIGLARYPSADAIVEALAPSEPIFCINPGSLAAAAARFLAFPGRPLYAVKCNPHPFVLRTLYDAGIKDFDVASLAEIELVEDLFGKTAGQYFNNPAKSRPAIRKASSVHGVRFYTVDCLEEVDKILEEGSGAEDFIVAVRLATPSKNARYVLSTKFGAAPDEAARILSRIHALGLKAGIAFHVGSQCLAPQAFGTAIALAGKVIARAGVPISVVNVGGGFPAPYPGDDAPVLDHYFAQVVNWRRELGLAPGCMLLCEPGRALVAEAGSVLLQVVMRRDQSIYVNDGVFGTLQELGHPKENRPVRLIRRGKPSRATLGSFRVYGPTCDSNDVLGAPFALPADVREGDWIEVGMMGAYSLSMRTRFNGFHNDTIILVDR